LALDQDYSRTSGLPLLSANHPLTLAAARLPGHRQERFARVRLRADGLAPEGHYLVILSKAVGASAGGDELWGGAVQMDGGDAPQSVADALLAALAQGALQDQAAADSQGGSECDLSWLASRCVEQLELRQQSEQELRSREFEAMRETRRQVLMDQCERRIRNIENRIETLRENRRGSTVIALFEAQRRRAVTNRDKQLADEARKPPPQISLEHIAACLVEVGLG
ncbi:MAG: hypothetical protein LBO20_03390, partial [Bifidobacteriaceae bacterium]|nr:hypothetical protein [Bifidobacteriaceae bacterium]